MEIRVAGEFTFNLKYAQEIGNCHSYNKLHISLLQSRKDSLIVVMSAVDRWKSSGNENLVGFLRMGV